MIGLAWIEVRVTTLIGEGQLIHSVVLKGDKVLGVISNSNQNPTINGLNDFVDTIGREIEA